MATEQPRTPRNIRKPSARSSLASHSYPFFYACYLLKSIRTPLSKATYIGSTPSPPRRIRQHNGEISQGAWKTSKNRPWAMQMIVHGFPSKLAALQFEWAWQHPHISRHLKDPEGNRIFTSDRKSKYISTNVQIVRAMISSYPYKTWPLHIKIFTSEAEKCWMKACNASNVPSLPQAFTFTLEFEGVDGNSGPKGSGRVGPIKVNDEEFTSTHLAKNSLLLANTSRLSCSVCEKSLDNYTSDSLTTALCPTASCKAVSHLLCLSMDFLSHVDSEVMIPRGGICKGCRTYVLWGDVIRGCYRRSLGGVANQDENVELDDGEMFRSDDDISESIEPSQKVILNPKSRAPAKTRRVTANNSEGEQFDFAQVEEMKSTDEEENAGARTFAAPAKTNLKSKPRPPQNSTVKKKRSWPQDSSGEHFDFDQVDQMGSTDDAQKLGPSSPKRSRPRIHTKKRPLFTKKIPARKMQEQESVGEHFDFRQVDAMPSTDESDHRPKPSLIQTLDRNRTIAAVNPKRANPVVHNKPAATATSPPWLQYTTSDNDDVVDWEDELRIKQQPNARNAKAQTAAQVLNRIHSGSPTRQHPMARSVRKNQGEVDFFDLTGDDIEQGQVAVFNDYLEEPNDNCNDEGLLSRALSVLSVSSPAHSPIHGSFQYYEGQVIELSD